MRARLRQGAAGHVIGLDGLGADRTNTCPACSIAAESRAAHRTAAVAAVATSVLGPPVDATARGDTSCAGPRARWRVRATHTAACRAGPAPAGAAEEGRALIFRATARLPVKSTGDAGKADMSARCCWTASDPNARSSGGTPSCRGRPGR